MAVLMTPPYLEFQDNDGNPLSGGKVYTYAAGTSNPKATFTDSTEATQNANPVILDAAGRATIWIAGSYKFVVTDADDNIIRTSDNVTSFNATAAASNSFFQSFSGNGSQTVFTLSEDLGTDENAIMVYVDEGGTDEIGNEPFFQALNSIAAQTVFTLSQDLGSDPEAIVVYKNTASTGFQVLRPTTDYTVSGTSLTLVSAPGAYTPGVLVFKNPILTNADNIGKGFQIKNPNTYTLSGTSLTFAAAPSTGTNNIMVFAPSKLVGAASASAAAAEGFADAAALSAGEAEDSATAAAASASAASASASAAANSAASFLGTSTTSVAIGTGAKSFTTQTAKSFTVGEFITVAYTTTPANYMYGQVTAYDSGTGVLDVNVTVVGGSGTYALWTIALSGERGATGPTGPAVSDGDKGDITVSSGGNTWTIDNGTITSDKLASGVVRERLTVNRTYYVRTDGSDSNNGLANTSGGAFLTINKAINVAADTIDPAGYSVTIQIGDGTYTTPVTLRPLVDGSVLNIRGNSGTPSNVVISTTSANAISTAEGGVNADLRDFRIQTTTSGVGLFVTSGNVAFRNLVFGATVFSQISIQDSGVCRAEGSYSIVGGSSAHVQMAHGGEMRYANSPTVTITGTPAFSSGFAYIEHGGYLQISGVTFSGSATGARYYVASTAVINTGGGGTSYLPGNAAGTGTNTAASPYGLYL